MCIRDSGYSHPVDLGIQQILAVTGRAHPPLVNGGRIGAKRYIFLHQAEVSTGLCGAF